MPQIPRKLTLVWDGAQMQRSRLVHDYLTSTAGRIVLERLPAYAPELNPVECMWGNLKTHQISNLIATQAWDLSMQATAAAPSSSLVQTIHVMA